MITKRKESPWRSRLRRPRSRKPKKRRNERQQSLPKRRRNRMKKDLTMSQIKVRIMQSTVMMMTIGGITWMKKICTP